MAKRSLEILLSVVEFGFLLLLWTIFVGKFTGQEFAIGVAAAAIAAIADAVVKTEGLAPFRPHARWVWLILWEPWYVLKGTAAVFRELARKLLGKRVAARFWAAPYRYGGNDDTAAARRALFIAYMTISPDTIVVGLDKEQQVALIHQLGTQDMPEIGRRLGAEA
jgi:multisubunit Na+/H+ antiporter MnhE subunit